MDYAAFTDSLLTWFRANARDLPWRRTYEPYQVWVSEIMAQQTQMERVISYFERWMERFPDVMTLAGAEEDEVLKLWEGLGYYSRARNLHKAARVVVDDFSCNFPNDPKLIRSLPGVGEYTSGAIASIAYNKPVECIDANVLRVFSRMLDIDGVITTPANKALVREAVLAAMPEDDPRAFNQALMELGALVCKKKPECAMCPVQSQCKALAAGVAADRPVSGKAKETIRIEMATGVLIHDGQVLIQKRRPNDVWPGLWEFPGGVIEEGETPEQALVREYGEEVELDVAVCEKIATIRYSYTRYRVTMHCYLCSCVEHPEPVFNEASEGGFVTFQALTDHAFPSGHRKLLENMRSDMRFASFWD